MAGTAAKAEEKPKNIIMKLAEIMAELDAPLSKSEFNKQQKYAFVSESAISAAVRPLLAARHIWVWSSEVERETFQLFTASSGNPMWNTRITFQFRFIDGETGEMTEPQLYSGQGADIGDKGVPKAQSMALKYFLLKTFMLSTGKDDAEADEEVDKQAAAASAKRGAKVSGKASTSTQKGGKTTGISDAQLKAITNIVKARAMTPVLFAIALTEATEITLEEGADLNHAVRNLTSEQAGAFIQFLNNLPEPEVVTDDSSKEDAEDEQGGMSVI